MSFDGGLRYGFTFSPSGRRAAALVHGGGGELRLETWRLDAAGWHASATGIAAALDDQLLPLDDGRIVVRSGLGRGHVVALVGPPRPLTVWPMNVAGGVRLLHAAGRDRDALALVLTCENGATSLRRLDGNGALTTIPLSVPGACTGGVWLDRHGHRLALNLLSDWSGSSVVVADLALRRVEPLFDVRPASHDRLDLYSHRSSLCVVRTDAGGAERIGFARLRTREPFWFPEDAASSNGISAVALDPVGLHVLLLEERGACSRFALYDTGRRRRRELPSPGGCMRGPAIWTEAGITVPWSTPTAPHSLLHLGCSGAASDAGARSAGRPAVVRVDGTAGPIEGIAYGGPDWRRSPQLVLALHGGPVDRWRYEFDPLFDALSRSGIAVLALNQRGSSGYGPEHIRPIVGAWGGPDLDDVARVVRELNVHRAGLVPPHVLGLSYGGYLALLLATLDPSSVSSCVALAPFLSPTRLHEIASAEVQRFIDRLHGLRAIDDAVGPRDVLRLADRLDVPVLLVHGRHDDVIPVEQSRVLRDHLHGQDVTYVELVHGGHDLLNGSSSAAVRDAVLTFLAQVGQRPLAPHR